MFTFETEIRTQRGTGASRRLRRQNQVPAVIYGGKQSPVAVTLNQDAVNNAEIKPTFYHSELSLMVAGLAVKVKVQAVQRHPFKPRLLHLDFLRI